MFLDFVNIISEKYEPMKESDIDSLQDYAILKTYKKNELVLKKASFAQDLFFVVKGSIRVFYDRNGIDKTTFFHSKGEFIWSSKNCTCQIPSKENYQALEETILIHFDKSKLESMFMLFPKLERIARHAAENVLMEYQQLIASHIILTPEERFLELMELNKELFLRAPQKHIASYLGISPETLCRIKRKIYTNYKRQ